MKHLPKGQLGKYIPLLTILVIVITMLIFIQTLNANASTVNLENPEHQAIIKAMEDGYDMFAYINQTDDPSKLSEIFVDTSEYQLPSDAKKDVEKVFGATVAEKAGYLTAMQAKTIAHGKINADMKAALDKAKAENREITTEEYRAIIEKNHGLVPRSNRPSGAGEIKKRTTQLSFERIELHGEKAIVYYDSGYAYLKAILVKIDGKWMIGGIEPIKIHF